MEVGNEVIETGTGDFGKLDILIHLYSPQLHNVNGNTYY